MAHLAIKLSSKGNDIAFDIESFQVPFGRDLELAFDNAAYQGSEILHNIAIIKLGTKICDKWSVEVVDSLEKNFQNN